ncbi:MAG: hypothetical protein QXS51_05655 [Thermoproteota archaeon]
MGKALQKALLATDFLITIIVLIPAFLWFSLNIYLANYKIGRKRKKMVKMLNREGLPEHVSVKIAEHVFPRIELSPSRFISLTGRRRIGENTGWKAE